MHTPTYGAVVLPIGEAFGDASEGLVRDADVDAQQSARERLGPLLGPAALVNQVYSQAKNAGDGEAAEQRERRDHETRHHVARKPSLPRVVPYLGAVDDALGYDAVERRAIARVLQPRLGRHAVPAREAELVVLPRPGMLLPPHAQEDDEPRSQPTHVEARHEPHQRERYLPPHVVPEKRKVERRLLSEVVAQHPRRHVPELRDLEEDEVEAPATDEPTALHACTLAYFGFCSRGFLLSQKLIHANEERRVELPVDLPKHGDPVEWKVLAKLVAQGREHYRRPAVYCWV